MGRDFHAYPIQRESDSVQIIACDRQGSDHRSMHHQGGLNILYDDSSVKFMERDMLGLTTESDIVVGPDAEVDDLGKVTWARPVEDD